MRFILPVLVALALTSCKGDFIETKRGEPRFTQETKSCSYSGLCRKCKRRNGKRRCGTSFHSNCSGKQEVQIRITPYKGYYEKEPNKILTKERREQTKKLTKCK